jgi:uncharacterized phosphosugar-binding protein
MALSSQRYYQVVSDLLARIAGTQQENIQLAAEAMADCVRRDQIVYFLGSGHSLAIAMEGYYRAGGLAPVDIIHDPSFGRAERVEGYAETILKSYNIPSGAVVVIISNSGRNAVPIETALWCKERGIRTIAVTSMAHTKSVSSRHCSGKRLFEIADIVIDNCGVPGDAILDIEGLPGRACPTSGLAGIFIVESIVAQTIENLVNSGETPPVYVSMNVDGGDEQNEWLLQKYINRVRGI